MAIVEAGARPGESWKDAYERLVAKEKRLELKRGTSAPPGTFILANHKHAYDVRALMDLSLFRLSKKSQKAWDSLCIELPGGEATLNSGSEGMLTAWDYDLVILAVTHLVGSMNRYRKKTGPLPSRSFRVYVPDLLAFCQRPPGGDQKNKLKDVCRRINNTTIDLRRERRKLQSQPLKVFEVVEPIEHCLVESGLSGAVEAILITVSTCFYHKAYHNDLDVLTLDRGYFQISSSLARFVYRLARLTASNTNSKWSFEKIYRRSGSASDDREFYRMLRNLVRRNDLPQYFLKEEKGVKGQPILFMLKRAAASDG